MPDSSQGFQARLSLGPVGTAIDAFAESCEFISESLHKEQTTVETGGMRGTRSHPAERTRDATAVIRGDIRLSATPRLLDLLLPRILGAPEVADLFALAETVPEFDVLIDRVARRFVYGGCRVDKAVFRGKAGGLLEMTLSLAGKTETVSAVPFPAITPPVDLPYVFHEATLTLLGIARQMLEFELVVDNRLVARFTNSTTATDVSATDRIVTLACVLPFTTAEVDLYGPNVAGAGAGSLAFTNGGAHLTFSLPRVQFSDRSPAVTGRGEILLRLQGTARTAAGVPELTVVNDSTP